MLRRAMIVCLLDTPTDDARVVESVSIDPTRDYPVHDNGKPRRHSARLVVRERQLIAYVPWWWVRQLTVELDPDRAPARTRPTHERRRRIVTTIIHIDGDKPLAVLDERGWTQGAWESDGKVCAHQAIRLCSPEPGDAYLIEQVAARKWHRGPNWNDSAMTTEADVREWLGHGIDVTDDDLADVFGPQWRAVVSLVRRAATLTDHEAKRLVAAWDTARVAARDAAQDTARVAARVAAQDAALVAAWDAARDAAWDAARGVVTWDLATPDGTYTHAHRDLLIGPWRDVIGLPEGLLDCDSCPSRARREPPRSDRPAAAAR